MSNKEKQKIKAQSGQAFTPPKEYISVEKSDEKIEPQPTLSEEKLAETKPTQAEPKQAEEAQQKQHEPLQAEPSPHSPGKQLKMGRERLGLSQKQVADRLHLRLTSVEAVETDALEEGVSVTFTKGYVRLYAKLVQIDAQPLLDGYDKLHATEREPAKLQSFSRRVSREAHDHRWNMVSVVVVFLVLGSIIFWWVDREGYFQDSGRKVTEVWETLVGEESATQAVSNTNEDKQEVPPALSDEDQDELVIQDTGPQIPEEDVALLNEAIEEQSTLSESIDSAQAAVDDTVSTASDVVEETFEDTADAVSDVAAQVLEETPAPKRNSADIVEGVFTDAGYRVNADGTVNVVFTFKDDCWVSVKDANGDTMAYGVKTKGRVMEVEGIPPVSIILGAPTAVEIDFGGQRVDMSVYPGGESAKFSLPIVSE